MSSAQVERRPSMPSHPSHTLANSLTDADAEAIEVVPARSISRAPQGPAMDVADVDEIAPQMPRRPSRRLRPTVVLDDDEPPTNRRRMARDTPENVVVVVDDNSGEGSSRHRGPRMSTGGRNRPIIILDSDDEQSTLMAPNLGTRPRRSIQRGRDARPSSSFRIFSPSPPPPPPIIGRPIPFILSNSNQSATHNSRPDNPAPRRGSGIHLGGGLLSHTHPRSGGRRRAPAFSLASFRNLFQAVASGSDAPRRTPLWGHAAVDDADQEDRFSLLNRFFVNWYPHRAPADEDAEFEPFGAGADGPWARRDAALGLGPDYEGSMTHPGHPGLGWTFDFGADDSRPGDGGADILACARCLDPLLANAEGMFDVDEEERRDRRVWGLRCGHVLDGKCVGALMRPESEDETAEKGKGKGKMYDPLPQDVKGKGRATGTAPRAPTPPSFTPVNRPPVVVIPDNPIRSRLRSRNRQEPLPDLQPTTRRRGRGTKRKREMDPAESHEVVEARYEWKCPVAGCGRTHDSIKVGGVWKMDPEDGAVAMFV